MFAFARCERTLNVIYLRIVKTNEVEFRTKLFSNYGSVRLVHLHVRLELFCETVISDCKKKKNTRKLNFLWFFLYIYNATVEIL